MRGRGWVLPKANAQGTRKQACQHDCISSDHASIKQRLLVTCSSCTSRCTSLMITHLCMRRISVSPPSDALLGYMSQDASVRKAFADQVQWGLRTRALAFVPCLFLHVCSVLMVKELLTCGIKAYCPAADTCVRCEPTLS